MVPGQVDDFNAFREPPGNVLDNLHMRLRPVSLAELPHVDNVTVEDYLFWFDGLEITKELFGVASKGAKMDIRNDYNVDLTFFSFTHDLLKVIPKARNSFGIPNLKEVLLESKFIVPELPGRHAPVTELLRSKNQEKQSI